MSPPPRPHPEARLLDPEEPVPSGFEVWVFEGTLERVIGGNGRFPVRQRVAWPAGTPWEKIETFGRWVIERLSINGHLVVGLRAWREADRAGIARYIG